MNLRYVRLVFGKEVREALRDRRTMFMTFVFPILFYPLLFGVFGQMATQYAEEEEVRTLRVAVWSGSDEGQAVTRALRDADDRITVVSMPRQEGESPREGIERGGLDILLKENEENESSRFEAYYRATPTGEGAARRLRAAWEQWAARHLDQNLEALGHDPDLVRAPELDFVNVATLREAQGDMSGGLVAYFLLFLCFAGCTAVAIDLGAGEKERGTLETLLTAPVPLSGIVWGKLFFVMASGLLSSLCSVLGFGILLMVAGNLQAPLSMLAAELFQLQSVLLCLLLVVLVTALFASVLLGISFWARTPREAQSFVGPMLMLVVVALLVALFPGLELGWGNAWIPVSNAALAIRSILAGTADVGPLIVVVVVNALCATAAALFASRWCAREDLLFR